MTEHEQELTNEEAGARAVEALTAIFGEASPETLFGAPERVGDAVLINAAAWERAGGFGFGSGYGEDDEGGQSGGGGGGGGGGASQGRPVAVIRVTDTGVEVEPVIDFTKIGVTVVLAAVGLFGALRRSR